MRVSMVMEDLNITTRAWKHTLECPVLPCPNDISFRDITDIFYSLLQGCIEAKNPIAGRWIYCQIVRHKLERVPYVASQLIRVFATCRKLEDANRVFERLPNPNLFAWNEMILAHIGLGCSEQALILYNRMQASSVRPDAHIHVAILKACANAQDLVQGELIHCDVIEFYTEPSLFVWGALIEMYSKCGRMQDAQSIFDRLRERNVVIWSTMITAYVKCGCGEEALRLYSGMLLEGFDPDVVTAVSILKACSGAEALEEGKLIHAQIVESGLVIDSTLGNSLLNMYARCASHAEACVVFKMLRKRDVVTWSSMVDSYAEHKDHVLALGFFELMLKEGVKPDEVALLCLLSACSQMGLVANGCHHFNTLAGTFGTLPRLDHFNCVVDLLGRAGCLIEAKDLLKTMPYQENEVGWRCFLNHSKMYSNAENRCHAKITTSDFEDESYQKVVDGNDANARSGIVAIEIGHSIIPYMRRSFSETATMTVNKSMYSFTVVDEDRPPNFWVKLVRLSTKLKEWGYLPSFK